MQIRMHIADQHVCVAEQPEESCHHGNISIQKLPQIFTLHTVKMGEIRGPNHSDKK